MSDIPSWMYMAGAILSVITVIILVLATVSKYYKKVSPNSVAVITGRKHKVKIGDEVVEKGYRYISGGGVLVVPLVEKMEEMSLNVRPTTVKVVDVPSKDGVKVTVLAIANVKILSDEASLPLAIERFLGSSEAEIDTVSGSTLEGNLRGIVGTMTVEGLVNDRAAFTQHVLEEAGTDLAKMGLGVDVVKIQSITDEHGYIDALGKKRTAEVVRDASIGEAEAMRETAVQTAEAKRAGETATAEADRAISDANRDRDIAIAENDARVRAQQAQIPIAADIAAAERTKDLNTANVQAEQAQVEAQIELEEVRARRNAAEQQATVVVPAEKAKEARIIAADAEREAAEREGEAARIRSDKEGQGIRAKQEGEAAGRTALAAANQAELVATAEGTKAQLLATAAGKQADLEALAAGEMKMAEAIRARLLAEAEGTEKKAEAFAKLDASGRFLLILEALPPVISAFGEAGERILTPVAEAIGEGLGNIDEVRIIDMGGGQGAAGKSLLTGFANTPVETIFQLWNKVKAMGLEPFARTMAAQAGIDVDAMLAAAKTTGSASDTTVDSTAREVPAKPEGGETPPPAS